jgi:hypothetical protein
MTDAGESLEYLERIILRMTPPTRLIDAQYHGVHPVDYKKGKHGIYAKSYDDPYWYHKEQNGDIHFWLIFHANWYDSDILCKSHPTTEMKSINWNYLFEIDMLVVREVTDACRRMNVSLIMSFNYDWNEEIVAQFYATLYVDRSTNTFHWTIQGKPFSVEYARFACILGFPSDDLLREKIHEIENVLEDGELHFMYDRAYIDMKFRTIHGLPPYYKLLNQLFCYTLCPKGGDSDNISNMSEKLIARMAPNQNEFSVFDFIWEEIII